MRKKHDNIRLYHVDHLGSTSLVTDIDGEITQHVAYIPYGEVFVLMIAGKIVDVH